MVEIEACQTPEQRVQAVGLVKELSAWDSQETAALGFAANDVLSFYYQDVDSNVIEVLSPPGGQLLLAYSDTQLAGCVGYRQMTAEICEMKYLYVRPTHRGHKLGRRLVEQLLRQASASGYALMRLETVQFMQNAVRMYESLGFTRCEPYYQIPQVFLPVTIFMQKDLSRDRP
jgi:putative acetyltransferase